MKRRTILAAAVFAAVAVTTGCQTPKESHAKKVDAASQRWATMRSGMLIQMAQQQFDAGDLDQAEKSLADAVSQDPKNYRLHLLAGRCALERGQLERAFQRLDTARELNPASAEPHYFQGIVLQRWQRNDQALARYEDAFKLQPDNAAYLLAVVETLVATNQQDRAEELLKEKITYFDTSAGVRVALAQLLVIKKDYDNGIKLYREALMLKPDDTRVVEELATAEVEAGKPEEAVRHIERLLADKGGNERKDLKLMLAGAYQSIGRVGDARDIYTKLTRADGNDTDAWIKLAEVCWAMDDGSAALTAANRAIQLAPRRSDGYVIAGMVFQKRGRVDEALRMFDKAAEVAPASSDAVILRGLTLQQSGKASAAAEAYAEALKRQPNDARAKSLLANVEQRHGDLP